jgi:hypothetical protein
MPSVRSRNVRLILTAINATTARRLAPESSTRKINLSSRNAKTPVAAIAEQNMSTLGNSLMPVRCAIQAPAAVISIKLSDIQNALGILTESTVILMLKAESLWIQTEKF